MATTTASIDNIQCPGVGAFDAERREMIAAVSRCWRSLYRKAFRYLGNAADAEDAVQDALLSACKHIGQFRGQAQMSTWLTAIVVNSARMQLRRRQRQHNVPLEGSRTEEGEYTLADRLSDWRPSPEEACRRTELAERVVHLTSRLSPPLRNAFRMCEL